MKSVGLVSFIIFLSTSCVSAEIGDDEPEFVASFSTSWVKLLRYVEDDLRDEYSGLSCFDIYLEQSDNEKIVALLPKDLVKIEGDIISYRLNNNTECGRSVAYHFDGTDGNFIRKVYQR